MLSTVKKLYSVIWIGPEAATWLKQATLNRKDTSKVPEPMMPTVVLLRFLPNKPLMANPMSGRKGINGMSEFIFSIFPLPHLIRGYDSKAVVKIYFLVFED